MRQAPGELIRQAGLRVTPGRVAVLDVLEEAPHLDAAMVHGRVLTKLPTTSIQSVHNILTDLTAARLIHRIEPAGSAALYERRVGDRHHHIICSSCGAVTDTDCVAGTAPCLTPDNDHSYVVQTAEVIFWGLCPGCQAKARSDQPS